MDDRYTKDILIQRYNIFRDMYISDNELIKNLILKVIYIQQNMINQHQ